MRSTKEEPPMKRRKQTASCIGGISSGASLGGKVLQYRPKQSIYTQGEPASTLFYIQAGAVGLSTRTKHQPSSVTAILGAGDLFGELCLAGYPFRMSTAVALTGSSIRIIQKQAMLQILLTSKKMSNSFVGYLLNSIQKYKDHVSELLTSPAEQRLARVLLRLAQVGKKGPAAAEIPILSHEVLAEMVGTTRSRVTAFMNRFRKKGFINYNGRLDVHQSLRKVLRGSGGTP
jgi:CRP/FNR family cyclic AMP-dependent transcriptional regulator